MKPRQDSRKSGRGAIGRGARRVARLLLPQRDDVQHHASTSAAPWITWISRIWLKFASSAPNARALADHADQQHHVEQRHDARPRILRARDRWRAPGRRSGSCAGRRRPAGRPAPRRPAPIDGRAVAVAGQHQQRERHDGEAAELQQRAEPDIGHAPPAQHRAVRVRAEADQRAERREHQRQRHHQRDQPGRHAELDDHHAVERAVEQHQRPCRPRPGTATGAAAGRAAARRWPRRRTAGSACPSAHPAASPARR